MRRCTAAPQHPVCVHSCLHSSARLSDILQQHRQELYASHLAQHVILQRLGPPTCRDLHVWVRYNGIANNAVRGAFKAAGVRVTGREHWNVLWGKAMKPSGYHKLHEQQRVSVTLVSSKCKVYKAYNLPAQQQGSPQGCMLCHLWGKTRSLRGTASCMQVSILQCAARACGVLWGKAMKPAGHHQAVCPEPTSTRNRVVPRF